MAHQKILAAIDLTDEAGEVLAAARSIADTQSSKLAVITVVKPLARVYSGMDMVPLAGSALSFEAEAQKQATTQLAQLAAEYGIATEDTSVCLGHPPHEIRRQAEEMGADLIVIGTHGRHGLGLLLGSTANAVLHGVPCDVLAVKIHAH